MEGSKTRDEYLAEYDRCVQKWEKNSKYDGPPKDIAKEELIVWIRKNDEEWFKEQNDLISKISGIISSIQKLDQNSLQKLNNEEEKLKQTIMNLWQKIADIREELSCRGAGGTSMESAAQANTFKDMSLQQMKKESDHLGRLYSTLKNQLKDIKGNIKVFVRVKPSLCGEMGNDGALTYTAQEGENIIKANKEGVSVDEIFPPDATQEGVFEKVSPFIDSALLGYNVFLCANGASGTGKTFTIQGGVNEESGIIPRAIQHINNNKEELQKKGWSLDVQVSDVLFWDFLCKLNLLLLFDNLHNMPMFHMFTGILRGNLQQCFV
mmetsp:Transcript_12232/g.17890  ORF Transcript_12232/g.17890 Transcript_12232/m.17890 type:complete len:322 (+) Transcript_12232:389-1354(+)